MEREYEKEIVHVFGTRLKLIYEPPSGLPQEIAQSLEKLRIRDGEITQHQPVHASASDDRG